MELNNCELLKLMLVENFYFKLSIFYAFASTKLKCLYIGTILNKMKREEGVVFMISEQIALMLLGYIKLIGKTTAINIYSHNVCTSF